MTRPRPLAVSSAVAVAAAFAALAAPGWAWLRLPLGLPLVLLLPGYGLVRAVQPRPAADPIQRLAIAAALSVCVVIASGLALDRLGVPLGTAAWTLSLAAFTLVADSVASVREARLGAVTGRAASPVPAGLIVTAALAAFVAVGAIAVSTPDSYAPATGEIVQLWALPPATGAGRMTVGVSNGVSRADRFHLLVVQDDRILTDRMLELPRGTATTFSVPTSAALSPLTPIRVVLTASPGGPERMVSVWPATKPR